MRRLETQLLWALSSGGVLWARLPKGALEVAQAAMRQSVRTRDAPVLASMCVLVVVCTKPKTASTTVRRT